MSLYSLSFSSWFFHMMIYSHTGPRLIFMSASWSHQCQDYTSHCLMRVPPRVTWHRNFCCSYNEYEFLSRLQGQWVLSSDSGPTFHHSSPTLTLDTLMFPRFSGKPCSLFPGDTCSLNDNGAGASVLTFESPSKGIFFKSQKSLEITVDPHVTIHSFVSTNEWHTVT